MGNGMIAAMRFDGVARDRIQINDSTCWSSSPARGERS